MPELAAPELAVPELAVPELAVPELAAPELAVPELAALEFLCSQRVRRGRGPSFPTTGEVIDFPHAEIGVPQPAFSVPLWGAYVFGWLMEKLARILPGDRFLIVRAHTLAGHHTVLPITWVVPDR